MRYAYFANKTLKQDEIMKIAQQQTKICFSYIRFSSEGQADGSSLDRESEIAPRVAREKGWTLREDLSAKDLGISAYKKLNLPMLRCLIDGVNHGQIPAGSVMIIEALDRLTRAELEEAYDLFRDILNIGDDLRKVILNCKA
jgi:hypothetical protein